jgi:hypothetical protein
VRLLVQQALQLREGCLGLGVGLDSPLDAPLAPNSGLAGGWADRGEGLVPGTTEAIALELAEALAPLEQRLSTPQGAVSLFAELGLPLSPSVRTAIEAAPESPQIVTSVQAVAAEVPSLVAAISAEDSAAVAAAVTRLAPPARAAFTGVQALAERVRVAVGDPSGLGDEIRDLVTELPERLVGWVVVSYLEEHRPLLLRVLALAGLMESTPIPASTDQPAMVRRVLHPERVAELLADPEQLLRDVYVWGDLTAPLDAPLLLGRMHDLLDAAGAFSVLDLAAAQLGTVLFAVRPAPGGLPTELDLTLVIGSLSGADLLLSSPESAVEARLTAEGTLELGEDLRVRPPASLVPLAPTGEVKGELTLSAGRTARPNQPLLLFGEIGGTRLTAAAVRAAAGAAFAIHNGEISAGLVVEAAIQDGRIVVAFGGADGFLASSLPATAQLDFDLGVRWSEEDGLTFRGGAGLALEVPLGIDVGPARLDRLDLGVRAVPGPLPALAVEARVAGGVTLGPFDAAVEGIGVGADLLLRGGGAGGQTPPAAFDLGPVAVGFRFLPPTGLGLSVDAGAITGGGFIRFDEPTGRYSGLLQLELGTIGVDAVGLLDTRLPGGAHGFALLVLLRASFPPVEVGFGFALSSVGGLLALNRRVDVDALRSRIASGTAGRILAPEDPVRNAPVLLSDLAAVFPPAEGVAVVGPTLQLSWVELVRFDIGVFAELPGPTKVVVLGSARATIENPSGGRPYLQLRLDVLGVADFAKQTLEFDAVLVDSHLLEILELTGGAAFRLSTGAEPYIVLTVGGFHPAYSPAPLVFPASLTRVAMTRGTPTDDLYFRFEGYFAVTTNTLQFGASVEVIVNVGSFNIRGFLGFDALIRFKPFHFVFTISASVKVRWKGRTLAGLDLRGELSGPGPVVFRGKVCFEILFFDICFEETFTLGSLIPPLVTAVASAVAELVAELEDPANLRAAGAADPFVAVAPAEAGTALPVVPPVGQLAWSQERAPLDLLLQRFEGAPLTVPETVVASGPRVTAPDEDWFAPGGFAELSDADALNRRAFERLHAGVRLGAAGTDDGPAATITVQVKQVRVPAPPVVVVAAALPAWVLRAVAGRAGTVERDPVVPALGVRAEAWVVRGGDGAVLVGSVSQAQAHQLATVAAAGTALAGTDTVPSFAF